VPHLHFHVDPRWLPLPSQLPVVAPTQPCLEKDAVLARTDGVRGVVWHFVASERSGTIGTDARILDLLDENGINYVIHVP